MTFEDMMQMRRLGSTDVSPDGKWLIYSVTDVDLAKNAKINRNSGFNPYLAANRSFSKAPSPETAEPASPTTANTSSSSPAAREASKSTPPTSTPSPARHGQPASAFFTKRNRQPSNTNPSRPTSAASGGNSVSSPKFDLPEADNAIWSPDGQSIVFTADVYPDCPAIVPDSFAGEKSGAPTDRSSSVGWKCNSDRDAAQVASQVKARIFDHLLYKHWNHFTGDKRSHLFWLSVETGAVRDLTPNDPRDVPPFSLEGGCGCAISPDSKELAFTENLDEEPAISTNSDIFTLDLTNPAAKPVKISTSPGGDLNPAYSPDGKYLAWRSQARAGYESDRFRLVLYDRISYFRTKSAAEGSASQASTAGWMSSSGVR